jgi:hypothetical protein
MRKGCWYGLGCVVVVATSPVWVPAFFLGLAFLLSLFAAILERI